MADSPGDGGGTGSDNGSSVATADAPTRQSSDQSSMAIDSDDGQEQGDARPPGRPLDSDNGRKGEAREPAQPVRPELGRKGDPQPKSVTDASAQPQDWREGESVELQTDQPLDATSPPVESPVRESPEVEAARADVKDALDRGERIQEARDAVDAAFDQATADGLAPNTKEQFEADFQEQMDEAPTNPDVKEVEFQAPGPAKEVEFQDPTEAPSDASQVEQSGIREVPSETHTPEEQRVVDDAKADLAVREQTGEVLGGDPVNRADQWHQQGKNDLGYQQDCALASTSAVLRDCGVNASESDVVTQAANGGLCETRNTNPADNGGVRDGQAISELLTENGVENQIENPQSSDELAEYVEQGRGVITEIDADELWGTTPTEYAPAYYDADGRSNVNHAVQVTGTVRDSSGELTGIVINDTGNPDGAGTVVPTEKWDACWSNTNNDHETVVTTNPTRVERAGR